MDHNTSVGTCGGSETKSPQISRDECMPIGSQVLLFINLIYFSILTPACLFVLDSSGIGAEEDPRLSTDVKE